MSQGSPNFLYEDGHRYPAGHQRRVQGPFIEPRSQPLAFGDTFENSDMYYGAYYGVSPVSGFSGDNRGVGGGGRTPLDVDFQTHLGFSAPPTPYLLLQRRLLFLIPAGNSHF